MVINLHRFRSHLKNWKYAIRQWKGYALGGPQPQIEKITRDLLQRTLEVDPDDESSTLLLVFFRTQYWKLLRAEESSWHKKSCIN